MINSVSLTMIVRNEEPTLPACLSSVADLVDEIIVVDTGSTDRTKQVASQFGARVYDFPWREDFAAARNESLSHARGNWILWLDGDEYLDDGNRQKMRWLISNLNAEKAAFMMGQNSKSHEGLGILVHQARLFRNDPEIRWKYRVHEQILPALQGHGYEIHESGICITHTGYQEFLKQTGKMQRNLRLLLLDLADRPDDPFTLFNLGLTYSKLRSDGAAVSPLLRSLETLPAQSHLRPKAYAALVRAYDRLGMPEEASAVCSVARSQFPEDLELLSLDGALRKARGDEAGAEACWKQVLWSRATPPVILSGLPLSEGAETLLEEIGTSEETADMDEGLFPCAGHNLALLFRQQGRTADAEAQWAEVQEEYPGFLSAWLGLGELYLDQERWTDLERTAEKMEREPRMVPEALALRAQAQLAQQHFPQARDLVQLVLSRDPDFLKAKIVLSHVLLQEGRDLPAAEVVLRDVLERDPANAQGWHNLVFLVRQQNRWTEAADLCQQACDHCPNDSDLLLLHGILLQEQGESAKVEACLLPLLKSSLVSSEARQRSLTARHYLALTFRDRGRLAKAVNQWQELLADAPDHLPGWVGLAEVHLARGDVDSCQEIAQQLSRRPECLLEAKVLHARVHLARKDFSSARQLLEEGLLDQPGDERVMVLLSQALLQEGKDWIGAEQMLRRILQLNPNNAEAQHNLEALRQWLVRSPITA